MIFSLSLSLGEVAYVYKTRDPRRRPFRDMQALEVERYHLAFSIYI